MNIPANILCTKSHEYIIKENSTLKIGITDYAIEQLGDIVFIELPEVGANFKKVEVFGTVESVKAASEIYMPVSGKITAINENLISQPELLNDDCYGEGWILKVAEYEENELSQAMKYDEYKKFIEG